MSGRGISVNFLDFEKGFDSVHRTSLWKILRQYGIQNSTSSFAVNSGVRQGCVMSSFLSIVIIDWLMKNGTEQEKTFIWWRLLTKLEDLHFADDIPIYNRRE